MSDSIKDKFLKEHALNDDDLDKVSGGNRGICPNGQSGVINWAYCQRLNCPDYDYSIVKGDSCSFFSIMVTSQ